MFTTCSPHVHHMFTACSPHVHHMFTTLAIDTVTCYIFTLFIFSQVQLKHVEAGFVKPPVRRGPKSTFIAREKGVTIAVTPGAVQQSNSGTYTVASQSSPSLRYTVKLGNQMHTCTCQHNRVGNAKCKHIEAVIRVRSAASGRPPALQPRDKARPGSYRQFKPTIQPVHKAGRPSSDSRSQAGRERAKRVTQTARDQASATVELKRPISLKVESKASRSMDVETDNEDETNTLTGSELGSKLTEEDLLVFEAFGQFES